MTWWQRFKCLHFHLSHARVVQLESWYGGNEYGVTWGCEKCGCHWLGHTYHIPLYLIGQVEAVLGLVPSYKDRSQPDPPIPI